MLLTSPVVAHAQRARLQVIGQPDREASLESAVGDVFRFKTPDGAINIPAGDVVAWGAPQESDRGQVLFADGSVLVAAYASLRDDRLVVISPTLGELALPLVQLAAIVVQPPTDPWRRDALVAKLMRATGDVDRLLLENGDELTGVLTGGTDEQLQLQTVLGTDARKHVDVPGASVGAIVFNPALRAKPRLAEQQAWLGLEDGSLLLVEQWSLDDGRLSLTRPGGAAWRSDLASVLRFAQPLNGIATYLSDLKPEAYRHVPYFTREWPYMLDRTVSGARLRAGGRLYAKGIGMHSASRLTFALNRAYSRFEADVAIDDEAQGGGSVVVRVFADAEERYRSPILRGGEAPLAIGVDISGAQRLSLVVDHADRGDQLDRADWLNARLIQ